MHPESSDSSYNQLTTNFAAADRDNRTTTEWV